MPAGWPPETQRRKRCITGSMVLGARGLLVFKGLLVLFWALARFDWFCCLRGLWDLVLWVVLLAAGFYVEWIRLASSVQACDCCLGLEVQSGAAAAVWRPAMPAYSWICFTGLISPVWLVGSRNPPHSPTALSGTTERMGIHCWWGGKKAGRWLLNEMVANEDEFGVNTSGLT